MNDFIKKASELRKQYDDLGKQIVKLYADNWHKMVGKCFWYSSKDCYIKIVGTSPLSSFFNNEEVLVYCYLEKNKNDRGFYEYTTKYDYFYMHNIPKDLTQVSDMEFDKHMYDFFKDAKTYVSYCDKEEFE